MCIRDSPYLRMMENAGTAAARELMARVPGLKAAAVFCGRGNNGGDGLVAARRLQDAGVEVIACLLYTSHHPEI